MWRFMLLRPLQGHSERLENGEVVLLDGRIKKIV